MLVAFLDLAVCPVSYDAVVFMVQAEMERRRRGAEQLHLVLVGEIRQKPQYDRSEAEWRLWNIVIPAAHLLGATITLAREWAQAERLANPDAARNWPPDWREQTLRNRRHLVGGVIERARAGEAVPLLRGSDFARRAVRGMFAPAKRVGWPIVTMTRRATYLPERNSDPRAWDRAQIEIERRCAALRRIDDTAVALELGTGFEELNLDLRMAMYQEADFNIIANCGPASLCWFSATPYVMLGAGVPEEEWDGLFVRQGLPLGESWPWATPNQRICYGKETSAQIVEEFDRWVSATN